MSNIRLESYFRLAPEKPQAGRSEAMTMRIYFAIAMLLLLAPLAISGETPEADRFVKELSRHLRRKEIDISEQEREHLRHAHKVLLRVAQNEYLRESFWRTVRSERSEALEWAQLEKMIRAGRIRTVDRSHTGDVTALAADGKTFVSKVERLADVSEVMKQVDPFGVFMLYAIE